ncbi:thioredoxin family protein [Riemerella columbipharyngis]|uniref:Thioredoxin-like n=1 Tax=Riemerella columbipharyngis TaxID=1071918 RepID=A0A1G7CIY2_9FLAO|nr:thioredoxin family protein [Riemerella columbipharyngis]SDE39354.1 Thioredoxin-like [Riemerella columbipharyngis]
MKNRIFMIALLSGVMTVSCQKKDTPISGGNKEVIALEQKDTVKTESTKETKAKEEMAKLPKPYHPEENAEEKLSELQKEAQKENKKIMIQAGGNWCIWCLRFNNFVQSTPELKELVDTNYLYYHLNYSPENKNEKLFAKFGHPEKFGFPVFIVLGKNGKVVHIQDSSVLEEGKGYSLEKVKAFFTKWK